MSSSTIPGAVMDGLAEGVLVFDSDRICVYANTAAEQLIGIVHGAALGHPIHRVVRRGADSLLERACRRVEDTRQPEAFDDEDPGGRCYRFRLVPSDAGVVVFLREYEAPACPTGQRDSPGLLQQVIDFAPVGITLTDRSGRLTLVNHFASTWVGQTSSDVLGHELADFLSPELVATVEAAQERVRDTQLPELVTAFTNPSRGEPAHFEIAVFAVYDEKGTLTGTGAIYNDVTAHEMAQRAMRDAADERRRLLDRVVDAQRNERARIAANIHDDSIQALAAVGIRLTLLERSLEGGPSHDLIGVHESLTQAMDRLRNLLFDLEPVGADMSLALGIRSAAEFVLDPAGIAWTAPDPDVDLPYAERLAAVRIAKEALANVHAHAAAASVTITARREDDGVELAIADDGLGAGDARSGPGHRGVTTMHDLATVAGGWLRIEGGRTGGTTVRYWLPAAS